MVSKAVLESKDRPMAVLERKDSPKAVLKSKDFVPVIVAPAQPKVQSPFDKKETTMKQEIEPTKQESPFRTQEKIFPKAAEYFALLIESNTNDLMK